MFMCTTELASGGEVHPVELSEISLYLQYGCKGDRWWLSTSHCGDFNDIRHEMCSAGVLYLIILD